MGFLDKYKLVSVEKPAQSKSRTWEQIVDDTIDEQIRIAGGEKIYNTKKNKQTGEYGLKKSWWQNGKCVPRVWIKPLFGKEKALEMDHNTFKAMLDDMKGWRKDPDLKKYIDSMEKDFLKQMKNLKAGAANSTKSK